MGNGNAIPMCSGCGLLMCTPPPDHLVCQIVVELRAEIKALTDAHCQHRSSDQHFLRSLGLLTEKVGKLEERIAALEAR